VKKLLFIFLIPIFSFAQNGDTNGDGFVNLEDLFNVLENWLSQYPDSVATIEDFSNTLDSIETVFENMRATSNGINILFPEGIGDPITFSVEEGMPYIVPSGKRLYINQLYSGAGGASIDDISISYNSNASSGSSLSVPLILNSGQEFSRQENGYSSFNGFLVDETELLEALTVDISDESYTVPEGKRLYITNLKSNGAKIMIDDIIPIASNPGNSSGSHLGLPIILNAGQQIVHNQNENGIGAFNGYLVDENYFLSSSTNNFQSNSVDNTSVSFNYSPSDCDYINSLELGTIIHQPTETSIVVMGKECGSVAQTLIPSFNTSIYYGWSQSSYIDPCDLLHTFTVNDTIVIDYVPNANYSSSPSVIYDLGESSIEFHPNNFTNENNFEFVGILALISDYDSSNETILVPGRIYGRYIKIDQDVNGQMEVSTFPTNYSELLSNNNLWKHEYNFNNGVNWVPTNYYPKTQSTQYFYNFGKKTKTF